MSESKEITINSLYLMVQREVENEAVQEVDRDLYVQIAEFIGELRRQEFDNVEGKIKAALIDMATELATVLVQIRLEKSLDSQDPANLLDEEKHVMDSQEERGERTDAMLSAMLNGRSRILESVSRIHKARSVTVRFLKETDEFVGADLQKYGPYRAEDLATIPYDNAQALISKEAAVKVRLGD